MSARASHYWAHLRPRTFLPTFLLALTGYAASPGRPAEARAIAADLALLFVVHSVLLWGGANAFNSAQDGDEGPINLLPNPPPVPPHLSAFGLVAQIAGVLLASLRGVRPALIAAAFLVCSTFYSWRGRRHRRGKEIGGVDNVINAGGSGAGAILLGYVLTPVALDMHILFVAFAFTVATFGGVPTSQIFQLAPHQRYADARNYAALLGAPATLRVGAALFLLHVVLLGAAGEPEAPVACVLWIGWAALALMASAHSWSWSRTPFVEPYRRMTRQLTMMMASQTLWTAQAWIQTA